MAERPAYLVALARLRDRVRFGAYVAALPPVYAHFGGLYLAVATASSIEQFGHAAASHSVVISRWPSLERLQAFWASRDYRKVLALRAGTGEVTAVGLEGHADAGSNDALPAIALILGSGPSPALLEAGGAQSLACVRERELSALEGDWTHGDVALYGFAELTTGRKLLSQLSSGQRGRSLLLPGIPPTVEMPCGLAVG
jgi:uncharacterized protein (DUF1330 family)